MRLRELSFLNKGVMITLTDERAGQEKSETFHAKGGLKEFIQHLNASRKPLHTEVVYVDTTRDDVGIELAMQYNDGYNENVVLVRQQHQHARRRHAPHRLQVGADARHQRLRRQGQLPEEGGLHALRRRRARRPHRGAVGEGPRAAVRGADQDEARQLRSRVRGQDGRQRMARGVPRRASAHREHRHREGGVGGARARGGPQGARPHAPQVGARRRQPARQARRLLAHRSGAVRAVPRRGRLGRRLGQAGAGRASSRRSCRSAARSSTSKRRASTRCCRTRKSARSSPRSAPASRKSSRSTRRAITRSSS